MKRIIIVLMIILLATSAISSCGKDVSSKDKSDYKWQNEETLNDWQKNLLEAEGLPTELDELTASQKYSIQRIYEMITYLNKKYGTEFIYAGYIQPGINESEKLYAYPENIGSGGGGNIVTVKVDKNGEFTDDYSSIGVKEYSEQLINDFITSYLGTDDYFYFSTVNACKIEMSEIVDGNFQWKYGASNIIFIKAEEFDIEQVEKFTVSYAKFLYEHQISGKHRINVMCDWPDYLVNQNNCGDWYEEVEYIGFYSFSIHKESNEIYSSSCRLEVNENGRANYYDRTSEKYSIDEYFAKY